MGTVAGITIGNIEDYYVYSFTEKYLKIMDKLSIPHCEIICKSKYYGDEILDFFEVLSHQALVSSFPLLLFVDSVEFVAENVMWIRYRKNNNDIIIDSEGNVYKLKDIIKIVND